MAVSGRRAPPLEAVVAKISAEGGRALAVPCDVTTESQVEAAVSIRLWARLEEQQSPVAWIAMLALPRLNGQERAAIIVPVHTGATPSEVAASMHERFQTVPSQYGPTLADVLADSRDVVFAPAPGGVDAVVITMSGAANTSPALEADNWVYFDAIAHARNGDLELLLID